MPDLLRIARAASAVDRLRSAVRLQRVAEAEQLRAIADLAAQHDWTTDDELDVIGERTVRIGADGTPLVGEFLPLEVAAATGRSIEASTWLIRDVLNLQARLPRLWSAVLGGAVETKQAFVLVQLTSRYDLSGDQAIIVDDRLRGKYGQIAWSRVLRLARGLIAQVAADKVEVVADAARRARFVKTGPAESLVSEVWARVDAADAQQLEASIQAIAATLRALGDADELDVRRARALGILATPGRAAAMLEGRDDERYVPRTKVYLHLNDAMLNRCACEASGAGEQSVARSETLGPITRRQLAELFGTSRISVTPVLQAGDDVAVDRYEVSRRMREQIILRDVVEPFPFSGRSARGLDADHTVAYRAGGRGQTRPSNLGPFRRRLHRAKTAGRWRLRQPRSGVFWWQSPTGQEYRVTPKDTIDLHDHSPLERGALWLLDTGQVGRRPST